MDKLKFGEIAVLENGKEYICFSQLEENGVDYVYLLSNFKPLDIKFARQSISNGNLELTIIEDQEEKQHVYELFQNKLGNSPEINE